MGFTKLRRHERSGRSMKRFKIQELRFGIWELWPFSGDLNIQET